ncbi:MAG: hypothetical protein WC758_06755 [Candidatus Woesearchaeota archaeon]|jgi:hypothetical protein
MKKKAQAAIEFLMTYGWALLMIIGIISAIYLFSSNPKDVIPNSCSFGDSFDCVDAQILQTGKVLVSLKNLVGTDILINSTICEYNSNKVFTQESKTVAPGELFQLNCSTGQQIIDKAKVDFVVVYIKEGYTFPSSSDGVIIAEPSS